MSSYEAIQTGGALTGIGKIRLMAANLRGDLLLALSELLHVVGHDGFGALRIHGWFRCRGDDRALVQ